MYAPQGQEDSGSLDFGEPVQIRAKDAAQELQIHELTLADGSYQTGRLQLLNVVGQGRGAYPMRPQQDSAGRGILGRPNLLENLEPAGLGQGPRDLRELPLADWPGPRSRHLLRNYPVAPPLATAGPPTLGILPESIEASTGSGWASWLTIKISSLPARPAQ